MGKKETIKKNIKLRFITSRDGSLKDLQKRLCLIGNEQFGIFEKQPFNRFTDPSVESRANVVKNVTSNLAACFCVLILK